MNPDGEVNARNGKRIVWRPALTILATFVLRCTGLAVETDGCHGSARRSLYNGADQPMTLSHNLICDNIPEKIGNSLFQFQHVEAYRGDCNAFFSRKSDKERVVADYTWAKGQRADGRLLLEDLRRMTGQDRSSFFANPGIKAVAEIKLKYTSGQEYDLAELHQDKGKILPLDFADFMADPKGPCAKAADGKPIGLDPAAFR